MLSLTIEKVPFGHTFVPRRDSESAMKSLAEDRIDLAVTSLALEKVRIRL